MPSASPRSFVSCTDSVNSRPRPKSWSRWKRRHPPRRAPQCGQVVPSHEGRGDFMATATAEAPETVRAPFFTTKVITFIAFTATLIFSQNMFAVSSQIGVGDWEFWIDRKDYAWAPFVYTWIVAVHFPVYSWIFNKFFKIYFGSTLVLMFWFLQRTLMIQLFYVGMNNYPFNYVQLPSYLFPAMAADFALLLFGLKKHMGLYVLVSAFLAGVLVVPGHFLFLNTPFLLTNVGYPDPLTGGLHTMPVWSLIRMTIPKAPIPSYIAEGFTWPLPYKSFYDPYIIMTGFMGIMGVVWSGFTFIFLKSIFYGYEKTIKHFVKPAGASTHGPCLLDPNGVPGRLVRHEPQRHRRDRLVGDRRPCDRVLCVEVAQEFGEVLRGPCPTGVEVSRCDRYRSSWSPSSARSCLGFSRSREQPGPTKRSHPSTGTWHMPTSRSSALRSTRTTRPRACR